jgi:dipeptide transport system permease protein
VLRFLATRLSLGRPDVHRDDAARVLPDPLVPGDPIETMAGERGIDAVRHEQLRKEYGLDRPVIVQYGIYIGRVLHGDLGKSMITQEPVLREFASLFPATIELALCAIVFALAIGIPPA